MTERPSATKGRRPRSRVRRRITGALALALALGSVGVAYATVAAAATPKAHTAAAAAGAPADDPVEIRKGRQLYETSCITCHGQNLQGVAQRGPSLIGAGSAAVYFQVATGRMPVARQEAQVERKKPKFDEAQTLQIAAYVQSVGGGPQIPTGDLRGDDANLAEGGELFRLNCASCHNFAGRGGALSAGKYAPPLTEASDLTLWTAMLSGPQNMPVFSDNQLTTEQKQAITNYVQTLKAERDPGGSSIGRLGPVPEGLVIWIVGIGAIMLMILWIGAKS
ncbi:MAG TPA: c-type cytochrome [Mycobacteriales bacterium]|nr:c-type cytochrome [Mycobacteriales bacterium]